MWKSVVYTYVCLWILLRGSEDEKGEHDDGCDVLSWGVSGVESKSGSESEKYRNCDSRRNAVFLYPFLGYLGHYE